jgi:hypothetical protein
MGIINPIEVNPVTLQALINATYAVLAENNVKLTPKLELLEMLLDDIEIYYLKDLEN